jgi:RNA polymerase sigma-70 factor (ECF subfamily)
MLGTLLEQPSQQELESIHAANCEPDLVPQFEATSSGAATALQKVETTETTETAETSAVSSEKQLIEAARQGDAQAFDELIRQNYKMCLTRALWMIRNRSDAEDEVQNACWKAFQRLSQFRGEGTFSAWLSRIVENQCLMRIREDRQVRFLHLDEASESNIRIELVAQMADPEDELGSQQLGNLLRTELSRVPPLLRGVMVLYDVEGLAMPDVAARLGLSIPAAKSRLMRARVEMRARLSKHCGRRGCGSLTRKSRYNRAAYAREN